MRIFLALFFLLVSGLHAQDAYTGASTSLPFAQRDGFQRSLLVYLYGQSGNLNPMAGPVFQSNNTELSLRYSQNFTRARWLYLSIQADIGASVSWRHSTDNTPIFNSGSIGINNFKPALRLSLRLTPYARVEIRTDGIISGYGFWTNRWRRHFLTLLGGVELNYLNFNRSEYTFALAYEYLIQNWTLHTSLGFRFNQDFLGSFRLRWDALLGYDIDGTTLWGRLRYEPREVLTGARHEISLSAGFNYYFQFLPGNAR